MGHNLIMQSLFKTNKTILMRHKKIIIIYLIPLFIIFPIVLTAQIKGGLFDIIGNKELDSGFVRVYYNFSQIDSTQNKKYDERYMRIDIQCLEIGSQISKYYSYAVVHNDSLLRAWLKKNPSTGYIPGWITTIASSHSWSEYRYSVCFKNFTDNQLTLYTQMTNRAPDYQYSENLHMQNWEIQDDTLTIAGYLCQKAGCHFRGRDFIAWFTPDIPINNGPWKFGGLPGLIMKVSDKNDIFVFECVRVEQKDFKICMPDFSKYGKIDRIKLSKFIIDLHEDYPKMAGQRNADGTPRSIPSEYPYRPLELE